MKCNTNLYLLIGKIRIKNNDNHHNKIKEKLKKIGKEILLPIRVMLLVSTEAQLKFPE